jgi:ABC-2 type transport system permease protein
VAVRLYWEVARTTARRMATYRAATLAGIFTNTVFGFILAYVMLAVFRERPTIGGFDSVDAVTFTFVAQGMFAMTVGNFSEVEMADRIKTGEVAVDLSRPFDFQAWWAAVGYGRAFFLTMARGIPPVLAGAVAFGLRFPDAAWIWPVFGLTLVLAAGVAFAWGFLLQLCAFWILDVRGPNQIGWLAAQFLSGSFFPVVVFPDGAEQIVRALPFVAMVQLPIETFLGKHSGADLAGVLLTQIGWLVALVLVGRVVLARAVRKVVVQGG